VLEVLALMAMLVGLWILVRNTVDKPPEAEPDPDPGPRGEVVARDR
jgi:hypothetical protein